MTFDLTKPVQTRDGRKARIICANRQHDRYSVIALVRGSFCEIPCYFNKDGISSLNNLGDDLVNVPERKSVFLNVYKNGLLAALHLDSLEAARNSAVYKTKYAILELQLEDEELINVVIHPVEEPSSQA